MNNFNRFLLTVLLITIIITLVNTNMLINNTNIMIKNNMEEKEGMKIGVNYKLPALKEIN